METIDVARVAPARPKAPANGATYGPESATPPAADALLAKLGQDLGTHATVDAVFGQPQTIGERTVIPVARIAYGFGGGTGGARGKQRKAGQPPVPEASVPSAAQQEGHEWGPQEFGSGGGGGVRAEPVAVVEIGPKGVRVVPIVDVNRMIGRVFAVVFGFAFAALVVRAVTARTQRVDRRRVPLLRAPRGAAVARVASIVLRRMLTRVRRGTARHT